MLCIVLTICIITQSVDLVFVISWVSQCLDRVTVSQSWLITLSWSWLFQISQKPHPSIINIVKVLQCHQISTFWCVINSSACTIDEWKYKSIAEKIFHNSAKHGCHFYEKFDSLSYTVKHWTRFRKLHGKCWHTVFMHKLLMYQKPYKWGQWTSEISDTKTSAYIPYKALSMWCCVYFVHTETFIILATFFISFKKAKICGYTPWNDKQTKSICLLVKCLLIILMRVRIWDNPKITSNVNFLFWMLNWKWLNLRKWLIWT